ncbi:MAG TPA: autotransporter domain-containing protein [Gammaproteobacteria bacterium]|nr:autotransporter domain-containing protein [Gammaproteobacteria bacterium]
MRPAHARNDAFSTYLGAAVTTSHVRTEFDYPGGAGYSASISRYSVTILQAVAPDVDFGLGGDYFIASLDSPALAASNESDGRAYGISLRWHPRLWDYLGLDARAGYRWNDMDFSTANTARPQVNWRETRLEAGPVLYLGNWRVSLAARWWQVSGRETDPGPPAARFDFGAAKRLGFGLGVAYYLDRTGSVGLYATTGAERGAQLVFMRGF